MRDINQRAFSLVLFLLTLAFWTGLKTENAQAIVIRHDKSDSESVELGKRFKSVCRVIPDGSCTLIADKWVATAAHVAQSIRVGGRLEFGDETVVVKKILIHPRGYSSKPGRPPEVDLALLKLEKPISKINPTPIYRGNNELGKTLFIAGYGDFGNPNRGLKRWDGKLRAATNIVGDAGPKRIFMKFDQPGNATSLEGVGGPGDSGGPAFIEKDGKLYLAGVSSGSMNGKPGTYGVIDVYTRVSEYSSWIAKTMNAKLKQ